MDDTIETCRRLYNSLLDYRIHTGARAFEQKRALTAYRKGDKFLMAVHSQVLQDVVFRLDKAYGAFHAGLSRFPRFKRRGKFNSFRYPQLGGFRIIDGRLRLSKIGLVRARLHRRIEGAPKTCTIVRDIDQWYACVSCETESQRPVALDEAKSIGVDLGLLNLATLSDGRVLGIQGIFAALPPGSCHFRDVYRGRRALPTGKRLGSCSPRPGGE